MLGGGYAGLMAAFRLAPDHDVALVDPKPAFVERVRLHELAAGTRPSLSQPYATMTAGTGVTHVYTSATAIDRTARQVVLTAGTALPYDGLVYALGSRWDIRLVTDGSIGADLSTGGRRHVLATLRRLGVDVEEGRRVDAIDGIDADAVVWTAAMTPASELAVSCGIAVDPVGRIQVADTLQTLAQPEIVVAGDAAAGLRMSCAAALPTGAHAADALISLGRRDGLIQVVHADDSPRGAILAGGAAALAKERVVRSTMWALRTAARRPWLIPHLPYLG